MVITCPSCAARYRLNPDKIQGRGAKITCPKCAHVFVVFTDQEEPKAAAPAPPKVKTPPRPSAPPPAPRAAPPRTSPVDRRKATQTGAFKAVGIDVDASESSNKNVRIVAPGPRSTRRVRALSNPAAEVPRQPVTNAGGSTPLPPAEAKTAGELDFRAVGIKTWKVKVAIGLIYDFSDISTLKKYLADKKVTPDDLISHNNSDWTRIGDIEDLEQHFVTIWKEARAAIDRGDKPEPVKKKAKTSPGEAPPVGASTDSFRIDQSRGRSSGAYGTPAPARRRKKAEPEKEPGNKKALWAIAALVIIGLPLAWMFRPQDAAVVTAPPPPPTIQELEPSDEELAKIQENIRKKIEAQQEKFVDELGVPEEGDVAEGETPQDRELVPVPPSERGLLEPVPSPTPTPSARPKYTPPPKPEAAPVAEKAPEPEPKATIREKKGDPARMYLDAGRKKLASGDYGSAKKMFAAAIGKNSACGQCYEGLAEAEKQLGNAAAAEEAQNKANQLGNTQSLASP
ncbi:MAG: zinc-ribbon domain-containing protein [Deltaproteobacteria bacterium]|nr:zinc-ribbon domain-containing protein [Deltaproteobacteria bacterium]